MCGIVGVHSIAGPARNLEPYLESALKSLSKRGPDKQGKYLHNRVALGHTRLSIIDVSDAGSQPMIDSSGRYVIIFNGEIYNHKELRTELEERGIKLNSHSDTEVLLNLYILYKEKCLDLLNGFFAFAVYDNQLETIFIARDRIGIKPLLFYQDDDNIIFASEMKAIMSFPVKKELDNTSLYLYFQLNYIPAPSSVFKHVKKLLPGHYMTITPDGRISIKRFFSITYNPGSKNGQPDYEQAKESLRAHLRESVRKRMISDVPLGAFLSGGIDSSVIVSLASQFTDKLNTFSIGYKDEPFFDETSYAELVAKKFNTQHTVFSLSNKDLYEHLFDILNYIDEPFADPSAVAVYILSKHTRSKVTVALSGDGADELFAGYNKHMAEYRAVHSGFMNSLVRLNSSWFRLLPRTRNNAAGNLARQLHRYAEGLKVGEKERYWRWCEFMSEQEASQMLNVFDEPVENTSEYITRKKMLLTYHKKEGTINDTLYTDMHLILPNDMLTKVDLMSMANSLEVRVPFLDHEVVNFVFSLPADFKLYKGFRKRILKDTFKDILPPELYKRKKKGFEVPMMKWFRNELSSMINDDLMNEKTIREQGIFNPQSVESLRGNIFSSGYGETQFQAWALIVFQYWWKKYMN